MQPRRHFAPQYVLWLTVVIGPDLSRMVPFYHLTFTSQKGTPLLVHPRLAILGHRSGSLQYGAIVPSDLLTSQKGPPLLVHPMLHPNISSPREAATLGEISYVFPATHVSPL